MRIIEQSWDWVQKPNNPLTIIEQAGRTCYKSESKIDKSSAEKFVKMIVASKHETVIEHISASVRFITNRGVTHELVRHRLCSFSQESTRYVKYSGEMEFIKPVWWDDLNYSKERRNIWIKHMEEAEKSYHHALELGDHAEQARDFLPQALKTDIVVTANLREWRHIFNLRCSKASHPQIRSLMLSTLQGFAKEIPIVFDDLTVSLNS